MSTGRPWSNPRRPYTKQEDALLRKLYPHISTKRIAKEMDRPIESIYRRACGVLDLRKTKEYLNSTDACRLRRGDEVGKAYRFLKGHVPQNKGKKMPKGWGPGRMKQTQFKKGNHPQTWKPIGSTRINDDGYLDRKVADTGYPPVDWKGEHVLLWTKERGRIPKGHIVIFKDKNRRNITIDNLECISKAENMRRNTIHNRYPKEIVQVIMLTGALKRQIRERREKMNGQKQDVRPARPFIRTATGSKGQRQAARS